MKIFPEKTTYLLIFFKQAHLYVPIRFIHSDSILKKQILHLNVNKLRHFIQ